MPSAVVILGRADKICENLCMHLAHCGRKLILVSDDLELLQNNVAQLEEEGAQVFGIFQDFGDVDAEELVARKILALDTFVDTLICSVYQVNTTIATQNPFPAGLKNAFLFYLSQYLVDRAAFHEGSRIVIISAPKKQDLFVVQMLRRIYGQYQVTTVCPPPPEKATPDYAAAVIYTSIMQGKRMVVSGIRNWFQVMISALSYSSVVESDLIVR